MSLTQPLILGIAHVAFQVSDLDEASAAYASLYGFELAFTVEQGGRAAYLKINDDQFLKLVAADGETSDNRLIEVAFQVHDAAAMAEKLRHAGFEISPVAARADGTLACTLRESSGHLLCFVEYAEASQQVATRGQFLQGPRVSSQLMHVGITVAEEAQANTLYRDTLGMRETWRGSRVDAGPDAWVNMLIPGERAEYVEYILLNGVTPNRIQLGSMHHICLRVESVNEAYAQLLARGLTTHTIHEPMVGRSHRALINIFDTDGTRCELME